MSCDVQDIYAVLLARHYQDQLFADLGGARKKEKGGRETLVRCPFCEKDQHFSYNRDKPVWRCWHCGEQGDWLAYLKKAKGLDFKEALLQLAQAAGVDVGQHDRERYHRYTRKAEILEVAQEFFIAALGENGGGVVREYLLGRGYSPADINAMEVGAYTSRSALQDHLKGHGFTDKGIRDSGLLTAGFGETHTLIIPWEDAAGRTVGLVGRTVLPADRAKEAGFPKYKYSAGLVKSHGLIGVASIRGVEAVVVAEGVLDARYLNVRGFKAVSVGGCDLSLAQVNLLESLGVKEVLLSFDMDEAGQVATAKAAVVLSHSRIRPYMVILPDGFKDPDELVRAEGPQALQRAIESAQSWARWHPHHICRSHDLKTDRGLESALRDATIACARIGDALDRRIFLSSLSVATGFTEGELLPRLHQQEEAISQQRRKDALQSSAAKLQQAIQAGKLDIAEDALEQGLQNLRGGRAQLPAPYLLEDFENDVRQAPAGLKAGFSRLDSSLRIPAGAITLIAGRTGHGKTTFMLNVLVNFLRQYPTKRFYLFSYEEARMWLALKLIIILAGQELDTEQNQAHYLRYLRREQPYQAPVPPIEEAVRKFGEFTSTGRLTIVDHRPCAEDLASSLSHISGQGDLGAVLIDYIQKIPLQQPPAGQRYQEVKRVSDLILNQAVKLNVPIILGAQLGRSPTSTNGKARVRLDNLRECGDLEQDAAVVLGIYNASAEQAEDDGECDKQAEVDVDVCVLKNRGGLQAKNAKLIFQRSLLRMIDSQPKSATSASSGW